MCWRPRTLDVVQLHGYEYAGVMPAGSMSTACAYGKCCHDAAADAEASRTDRARTWAADISDAWTDASIPSYGGGAPGGGFDWDVVPDLQGMGGQRIGVPLIRRRRIERKERRAN